MNEAIPKRPYASMALTPKFLFYVCLPACLSVCPKCFLLLMCSIQKFVGTSLPPSPYDLHVPQIK